MESTSSEHMDALSIDGDNDMGDSTMEIDVTMVQSPLPTAPPLPVAGPDNIRHVEADTFEANMHVYHNGDSQRAGPRQWVHQQSRH